MIAQGIPAHKIILFTFTKKAASEIRERVVGAIGPEAESIVVGTYHSVCGRLLRKYAKHIGLESNFSILDPDDCKKIMKVLIKTAGFDFEADKVLYKISDYKCRLVTPINALRNAENTLEHQVAQLYQLYEAKLIENNSVDFDNLIYKTVRLMQNSKEVREELNMRYQYIVADESHDSSIMDLELISLLTGENENLCLILDNDQSIYSFRGAKIEAVMNMRNRFPKMKTHILSINYRSTQTIVEGAKSLINRNTKLIDKEIKSNNEVGNPIMNFTDKDGASEAARIIKLIKLCSDKHGFKYSDIAILYRMNFLSREIEDALLKHRIPYKIVGGTNFYSRKEIKDIMSYFRLILNPNDTVSFSRAISTPKRGIGEKTIEKIIEHSKNTGCTLIEATGLICTSGKAKTSSKEFIDIILSLNDNMDILSTDDIIDDLLIQTGYINYVRETEKESVANDRIENIKELLEVSRHFESITELSDNITMDSSIAEENADDGNCVQLLTMHSSKGLEWNVVIVAGAVEGIMPSYRAVTTAAIEEERRLAYVAFTRAKKLLFITKHKFTLRQGTYVRAIQSRFVEEINQKYIYHYND